MRFFCYVLLPAQRVEFAFLAGNKVGDRNVENTRKKDEVYVGDCAAFALDPRDDVA